MDTADGWLYWIKVKNWPFYVISSCKYKTILKGMNVSNGYLES